MGTSGFSQMGLGQMPPQPEVPKVKVLPCHLGGHMIPAPEPAMAPFSMQQNIAEEVARLKQTLEVTKPIVKPEREDTETVIRMPPKLTESLLHPDNEPNLRARTGLLAASLNEEGLIVLRASDAKSLQKALAPFSMQQNIAEEVARLKRLPRPPYK